MVVVVFGGGAGWLGGGVEWEVHGPAASLLLCCCTRTRSHMPVEHASATYQNIESAFLEFGIRFPN